MAEQKKSGVLKWVLIGCGGLVGLGLLCTGGGLGLIYFGLKSMVEEVEPFGAAYLKTQPEIGVELESVSMAKALILGAIVQKVNDSGQARVRFDLEGSKGAATATVWLERSGGKWSAVGCEVVTESGKTITLGRKVEIKSGSSDWDD